MLRDIALDAFEGFASEHGPRFYGLPLNEGTVSHQTIPVMNVGITAARAI